MNGHTIEVDLLSTTLRSFVLEKGAEVQVNRFLNLSTLHDIHVQGTLLGRPGFANSVDGASICLLAGNSLHISGKVQSGVGFSAQQVAVASSKPSTSLAIGHQGGSGGSLELRTTLGDIEVAPDSHVGSGHGGIGANADAKGWSTVNIGEDGGSARAQGGRGGNAGLLLISAANGKKRVEIADKSTVLYPGVPGRGGNATANGGDGGPGTEAQTPGVGGGTDAIGGSAGDGMIVILGTNIPNGDSPDYYKYIGGRLGAVMPGRTSTGGSASGSPGKPGQGPKEKVH